MSILVTEKDHDALRRWQFSYLLISLAVLLFGAVYEFFSHGVYSGFMLYAFAIPLTGGTLLCFVLDMSSARYMPGRLVCNLYNSGIAALTVGCIFKGVLEIYGTTNRLIVVYWIAGFGLMGLAGAGYGLSLLRRFRVKPGKGRSA